MNRVSVPGRSRARGGSIFHGLVLRALIALPLAMVSCSGGDDGGGGGGGGTNNPPPTGSTANQFAYVIQSAANQIYAFQSDANGNLTGIGAPLATGVFPHHVRVDPRGRFVYVSNHSSAFLSGYRINQDGTLTPMNSQQGSPVTGLGSPPDPAEAGSHSSVLDQTGQFLYVIAGPETGVSTLKAYRIDTTPGATLGNLTALTGPGSSFPVGVHAHNMAISSDNRFIYVASSGSGEVFAFSRDTSTGALTPSGPAVTGLPGAEAVVVSPDNRFVYATFPDFVDVFQIGPNGALTRISGTSSFPTGNGPHSLTIHPNGQFLYVANINAASVSVFRVDQNTGALTLIQTQTTGSNPNYIVIHPNLITVYTADAVDQRVTRFTINADGTLSPPVIAASFPAGSGTNGIGTTQF